MPDLTVLRGSVCAQVLHFQVELGSKRWNVRWGRARAGQPVEYEWTCECPHFRFRGGNCKHITEAEKMRCHWGEGAFVGSPSQANEDGTCPECGGPTEPISVGV